MLTWTFKKLTSATTVLPFYRFDHFQTTWVVYNIFGAPLFNLILVLNGMFFNCTHPKECKFR